MKESEQTGGSELKGHIGIVKPQHLQDAINLEEEGMNFPSCH